MPEKTRQQQLGQRGEQLALRYLQKQGLQHIESNFHCRFGELDLIMQHDDALVFVEVRHRQSSHWGSALDSITPHKQQRLLKAAQYFLAQHSRYHNRPCRFDVISIDGELQQQNIQWLSNAIELV